MKTETTSQQNSTRKKKTRWLKILGKVVLGIGILFFLVVLFIRSPWGQNIIKNKLVSVISEKIQVKVAIDKLFLTFDGDIQLDGLYLEDKQQDTLIYSKTLEANIALWPIITGQGIGIDAFDWEGVRANIERKDTISGYNFEFLINAFASTDATENSSEQTTAPMEITLGQFNLNDFDVVYKDDVAGIDSHFIFRELTADMETTDVETMVFRAESIALTDANIKLIQKPVEQTDEASSPLPILSSEILELNNVIVNYESLEEHIRLDASINDMYTEIPNADLSNNSFNIDAFKLHNSKIKFYTDTDSKAVNEEVNSVIDENKKDTNRFEWPDLSMQINDIAFKNNTIGYVVGNAITQKNTFNPNAILLNNLNVDAKEISLKEKNANIDIQSASFKENSGYHLKKLSAKAQITDNTLDVGKLIVGLNQSEVQGQLHINYASLSSLIESPENSKLKLDFPTIQLNTNDVANLQPELQKNPYFNILSKKNFNGSVKGSGSLSDIYFDELNISWGNTTQLSAQGNLQNATNPDQLYYDIPNFSAYTNRSDIKPFLSQNKSITIPKTVQLKGFLRGNLSAIDTDLELKTSQGNATLSGEFETSDQIAFDAEMNIVDYQINQLLNNPNLGSLSASVDANGKGATINELDVDLDAVVKTFNLKDYAIKDLKIQGRIKDGKGQITSKYKDDNLNADLKSTVVLDSISSKADLDLDVIGADLEALGVMSRNVKTGFKMHANFIGNTVSYNVAADLERGVVVYDNKSYLIGNIDATAHVRKDTTSVEFHNKLIDLTLQSNSDPETFSKSIQRHIYSYFYRDTKIPDSIKNPVNLKIRGHISQAPVLNEVFLVNIKDLDTIDIAVDFIEKNRKLTANITAPHINYSGNEVDSLAFYMDTDQDKFIFNLGFNEVNAGPIQLPKSVIKGEQLNNNLSLDFLAFHDDEKMMNIKAEITGDRERLRFHVIPDNLKLNKANWTIPQNNEIIITDKNLEFNQFKINKGNQSIELTDKLPSESKSHIALDYKNFEIQEVFDYLNPDEHLASGILSGDFIIEEPYAQTGFVADLNIAKFNLMDVDMGALSLNGKSAGGNRYDMEMAIKGGAVDFDVTGNYIAEDKGASIDLGLDINAFNMKALTGFSQGEIIDATGYFSGHFDINGSTEDPQYEGSITFNNADFKIAKFNSGFTLKNETLSVDNDRLKMTNFIILDEKDNTLVVSGEVGTKKVLNPTFDLKVKAKNFQMLNATAEDNDFLYGKAVVDADMKINGDLQIPKINMKASIGPETNITYVMPSATANIEERDGVVVFVNRENPDAILTQTEPQKTIISGFDVTAVCKIKKGASATVVIDKDTGDNFKVSGTGDFNFDMKPNGRMNLVGVYNISKGHYEMNLYNIVNRRFDIGANSKVSWYGDPFDAKLDVRAIYDVETSTSSLMAPTFSSISASDKGRYRQVLPFLVYLNIDGELLAPKISFALDMPEDEQGAIGGQVYGRLQQLNQQESELNKQVFSLLVLNRFYPDSGSDGSSGGVASIARDNLNDALSDQLNIFSDKIFGKTGFEVDFGLDSYTDYQGSTPQDRTQLDIAAQKKLFNDRLTVRVGSEVDLQGSSSTSEATPLVGNVSLEYMLTENGRYRLKGFRRNEFENVIDGQTIATGLALIFNKEFNKFNELWDAMFKSQNESSEDEDLENAEAKQEKTEKAVDKSIEKKKSN